MSEYVYLGICGNMVAESQKPIYRGFLVVVEGDTAPRMVDGPTVLVRKGDDEYIFIYAMSEPKKVVQIYTPVFEEDSDESNA